MYEVLKVLESNGVIGEGAIEELRKDAAKESHRYNTRAVVARNNMRNPDYYKLYVDSMRYAATVINEIHDDEDRSVDDLKTAMLVNAGYMYLNKMLSEFHTELADAVETILAGECSLEDYVTGEWPGPEDTDLSG